MNKKAVTIVSVILIIIAIICFVYIFFNSKSKDTQVKVEEETEDVVTEVEEREERGQNVNVNSRIGQQLKELIKYSEIYSNDIIEELDSSGISSKSKLLICLDKIYRKSDYQSYLEYSETYSNTYILNSNMGNVLSATFVDSTISETDVDGILSYDTATDVYVVIARGFQTGTIEYTLEIPYKIIEYSDRLELEAYRVYITKNIEMNEAENIVNAYLYYDKAKSALAYTVSNDSEFTESGEVDYIKEKIDSSEVDKTNLETVEYVFNQVDGEYKILSFSNIDE